jgi:hypothetical protein
MLPCPEGSNSEVGTAIIVSYLISSVQEWRIQKESMACPSLGVLLHVKLWEAAQFRESEPFTDQQEAVFFVSVFEPSHG